MKSPRIIVNAGLPQAVLDYYYILLVLFLNYL